MKRTKTIALVMVMAVGSLLFSSVVLSASANPGQPVNNYELAGGTLLLLGAQVWLKYGKKPDINIPGLRSAAIQQELWADRIVDPWFANNGILAKVKRVDDSYILNGSVVHIPQAGANPAVVKNRTVFPGVIAQRTDTDVTYPLDVYTTDPVHITDAESMEISYNKVDSVLRNTKGALLDAVTLDAIHAWSGVGATLAAQIQRTTGALVTTNLPHATATGSRRSITYADMVNAMNVMNGQDVPSDGRVVIMDAVMYGELLMDTEITKLSIEKLADRATGVVAKVAGFDIMVRSRTCLFTNAATPVKKAPTAADAASDNRSALFFHQDCLTAALGDVKFFETLQSAEHYGDIYSAMAKAGFRQERSDGKGVISLVQAAA